MTKVDITKEKLEKEAHEIIAIVARKNVDYGDAWQSFGPFTALVNMKHKLLRLETLKDGRPALVLTEAIEDTLQDLVGYALLVLVWLRAENN